MSVASEKSKVKGGHYEEKLLKCSCPMISFAHQGRFAFGKKLIESFKPKRVLDFGCGDGFFLSTLADSITERVGTDLDPKQLNDCQARFSGKGIEFLTLSELNQRFSQASFDIVVCMEVLEHCLDTELDEIFRQFKRFCSTTGRVIISVPIETGPSGVFKFFIRKIAGFVSNKEYSTYEKFTLKELSRTLFAGRRTPLSRPVYHSGHQPWHSHKGFHWPNLLARLEPQFKIERVAFSPFPRLGRFFNSQVWIVLRAP